MSILFVEETGALKEIYDLSQVTDKHDHIMLYRVYLAINGVLAHNISGDMH